MEEKMKLDYLGIIMKEKGKKRQYEYNDNDGDLKKPFNEMAYV